MFWKVGVFFWQKFLKSTSEKFSFFILLQAGGLHFTAKIIKITSSHQRFQPEPQLVTIQSFYFKIHHFLQYRFSSYLCRLYCWLHYSTSLWINLLSSVCAYTLKFAFFSLLNLAYKYWYCLVQRNYYYC